VVRGCSGDQDGMNPDEVLAGSYNSRTKLDGEGVVELATGRAMRNVSMGRLCRLWQALAAET
jgi:hypothetical protein